jgi:hypothetical protein
MHEKMHEKMRADAGAPSNLRRMDIGGPVIFEFF